MKQALKTAAIAAAAILTAFAQPTFAAASHSRKNTILKTSAANEIPFSIELTKQPNRQVVHLVIINPGKKNLTVSLNGPDGESIDNFFAGKKIDRMEKAYNFSNADLGVYTFVVSDGKEKVKKIIKLESIPVQPVKLTVE